MDDREACEFYADPENHVATGPPVRRKSGQRQRSVMISVRFTPAEIEVVQALADAAGKLVSTHIRDVVLAGAEDRRPSGLIERSGRRGEPKVLSSSLSLLPPRTFACPHLSVGNVSSASCGTCGPLQAVA